MAVPTVELREEEPGRYQLEAQIARVLVSGAGRPVPPNRCSVGEPERDDEGRWIRLRYVIDCADDPLGPRDVVVLPWVVDGIQLTAYWLDGKSRRALFGREQAGVVIRLHLIMDRDESFTALVKEYAAAGWTHFWTSWNHLLFILALTLLVRGTWISLGGLLSGHAIALILAEAGVVGLPRVPADAAVAGAAVLLMAGLIKGGSHPRGLFGMTTLLGALHGLGMATDLVQSGVPVSRLVSSLFLINSGLDLGSVMMATAALLAWRLARPVLEPRREVVAGFIGVLSVFVLFAVMREGVTVTPRANAAGFMEVDTLGAPAPVSSASLAAPPTQTDAMGQLASPFMSYLIVEPYQIRHEVLVDVKSARAWVDVAADASSQIPVETQKTLTDEIVALVSERSPVTIDGTSARAASKRADFVSLGPTGALTREPPVPEPLNTAIVGVTLVYETTSIADAVDLEWGLFSDAVSTVPFTMTDPLTVAETELTPEASRFEWRNTLGDFELPRIEAIAASRPKVPLFSLGLAILALVAFVVFRKRAVAVCCLAAAYVLYPFARAEARIPLVGELRIDRAQAADVLEGLLTNVYRCFDIHNEDLIYDRLALTVTGEQLLDVYLESRRALELENRGGARVRIDEVVVREIRAIRETEDGGYELDTLWTVGGSVNHFGHIHFRQNRYDATITIVPVDGTWKILGLELIEEKRVL